MHNRNRTIEEHISQYRRDHIASARWETSVPLRVSARHLDGEPVPVSEALAADFEAFEVGSKWGRPWGTTWFHCEATVPDDWAGRRVEARIDLGGDFVGFSAEGQVWIDAKPYRGVSPKHKAFVVAPDANGGETVEFYVEAAANTAYPFNPQTTNPPAEPSFRLAKAELAIRNDEIDALLTDMDALEGLMHKLPGDEPRRNKIRAALERCINILDPDDVVAGAARAREALQDELSRPANASAHRVSAVGHAHIDSAWLWPIRETQRKCARTFSTAVRLMDDYPEYIFTCSQAQQYAWIKESYPALYEEIRKQVADGRFVPTGSMWVEPDCNVPSGESLARQLVHGKRFFLDEFGVETQDVWLPDAFGFTAQLPQLIRLAGCRWFLTQKISWNRTNDFPHHSFEWEGLDGTRVFAHFPPANTYNGAMSADDLIRGVHQFADHAGATRSLYPFGWGDGGGGPTREMLEVARRYRDLEGLPTVSIDAPAKFFEAAEAEYDDPPVWRGELYLELHRATFTTQAKTKAGVRRAEGLLREAELWSALTDVDYPADALDALWKRMLVHQFHDILPGTSITWVHEETEVELAAVAAECEAIIAKALDTITATRTLIADATSHGRRDVISVAAGLEPDGASPAELQRLEDGRLAVGVETPGMGITPFVARNVTNTVSVEGRVLDNGIVRVEIDADGLVASVWDHAAGREVLAPGSRGNLLQLHPDEPIQWDAWDIDHFYEDVCTDLVGADSIEVVETGPLLASLRITRSFSSSTVTQDVVVRADSRRIDFVTEIDWNESRKVLKVAFPVGVHADTAACETAFGHVQRPTHRNTSWDAERFEVVAHRWIDMSEHGYGVAVLNDAKYGHDAHDNTMRITLLRAPLFPDPQADRGRHRFTYSLFPHIGGLQAGGVIEEAEALNTPVRVLAPAEGENEPPAHLAVSDGAYVSAVKYADDASGDLIVRLHEGFGGRRRARLELPFSVGAAAICDLLERPSAQLETAGERNVDVDLRAFEVVTLRLGRRHE